jgi:hypothetical protein
MNTRCVHSSCVSLFYKQTASCFNARARCADLLHNTDFSFIIAFKVCRSLCTVWCFRFGAHSTEITRLNRGRGVTLTTHPHLVPMSRTSRSYTSSPPKRLHGVSQDSFTFHHTTCDLAVAFVRTWANISRSFVCIFLLKGDISLKDGEMGGEANVIWEDRLNASASTTISAEIPKPDFRALLSCKELRGNMGEGGWKPTV